MYLLYEVLLALAFTIALPWYAVVGFLRGKYLSTVRVRLGFFRGKPGQHDVWIHAVSVGEVMTARTIVGHLLARRPDTSLVLTTTTTTGRALAERLFSEADVAYFPFDFSFSVNRFLDRFAPRVFVTVETEIWPNAARLTRSRGARLLLANGRISDRSFPRYRLIRAFLRPVLALYETILVREEVDRERFVALGALPERIIVTGNVKFDYQTDETPLEIDERFRHLVAGRPVFVAGSTIEGEDEMIVPTLAPLIARGCFVVIAPRKPERFEVVTGLLAASDLRVSRRTEIDSAAAADVLLLDSIGELARMYRYATAVFVGGSLVPVGGHNPIEPAAAGAPVAFGPHMSNFREIAAAFLEDGGAVEVSDAAAVAAFVEEMISNSTLQRDRAARCRATVERNRGSAAKTAARIVELLA